MHEHNPALSNSHMPQLPALTSDSPLIKHGGMQQGRKHPGAERLNKVIRQRTNLQPCKYAETSAASCSRIHLPHGAGDAHMEDTTPMFKPDASITHTGNNFQH